MTAAQENQLKAMAPREECSRGGYAMEGASTMQITPPSIRDRIARRSLDINAQIEASKKLDELGSLLDKYPDLARILDLIDQVRP